MSPAIIMLALLFFTSMMMAVVAGGLEVNQAAIAANLEASGLDAEIGESVAIVNALLASLRRS